MFKLARFMKPHLGMLLMAVILLFIQASSDLALPDYMADIVNDGVLSGDIAFIAKKGGMMLLVTLISMIASVAVGYIASVIAAKISKSLRHEVFKKVTHFSGNELDKFSTASLITRTTNDITQIQTVLVMMIRMVIYAPILGVGGIIKAVSSSESMSWIIGIAVISLIGMIATIFAIAIPKFKLTQNLVDRLNLVARENIEGLPVIRAFNTQKFEETRFGKANEDLTATNLYVNRLMVGLMPSMMLIMNLTTVIIVWVGAKQVSAFQMDIGDMMAYMQYAMQIIMAFLMLSMMFIMFPRASVSAERIAEVLDTENIIKEIENPVFFEEDFKGDIEFKNVYFRYPGGQDDILTDINFVAKAGETTAIIGATGSGKSTLINLILRFYDITSGAIYVSGVDIRTLAKKDLRSKIGYVPQKNNLFTGTIKSNLLYSDKNAAEVVVEKAMRVAQATEFVEGKEEGVEATISQGGSNVSGGQKQRIAIARALVKEAPINIYDDSFSALDLKTDRKLRNALIKEVQGTTTILVAQRVSTIMDAEQIIVLDNGRIASKGTHKELLKTCEIYQEIARSQLSEEELAL